MKKIIFTLALVCAMITACSNSKTVETDSVVEDTVEVVDTLTVDTTVVDSVL